MVIFEVARLVSTRTRGASDSNAEFRSRSV
jgi:hypothetical protein